jgi:transcriptional regulator with XRE-family HTH domain
MSQKHRVNTDPGYAKLIEVFQRRRLELGLRQAELDHLVGWTPGQTHKYEQCKRSPTLFHIQNWCRALGVNLWAALD